MVLSGRASHHLAQRLPYRFSAPWSQAAIALAPCPSRILSIRAPWPTSKYSYKTSPTRGPSLQSGLAVTTSIASLGIGGVRNRQLCPCIGASTSAAVNTFPNTTVSLVKSTSCWPTMPVVDGTFQMTPFSPILVLPTHRPPYGAC